MDKICKNCRHYRTWQGQDRDGTVITLGYCHAISTYPYRTDEMTCKRFHYDEKKAIEQ